MEDAGDKCVCVCARWRCARLQHRLSGLRKTCTRARARIFFFTNKDKSTLNKSTSHYGEALIHRRSHLSCITDVRLPSLPSYFPFAFVSAWKQIPKWIGPRAQLCASAAERDGTLSGFRSVLDKHATILRYRRD